VKKAKVKAVDKVRNKDLVLPLVVGRDRSRWQAENVTGSSDETAVLQKLYISSGAS